MLSWPCIGEPRYTLCCMSECRYKYPHPSALWLGRVGARPPPLGGLTQAGRQALDRCEDPLVGSLRSEVRQTAHPATTKLVRRSCAHPPDTKLGDFDRRALFV